MVIDLNMKYVGTGISSIVPEKRFQDSINRMLELKRHQRTFIRADDNIRINGYSKTGFYIASFFEPFYSNERGPINPTINLEFYSLYPDRDKLEEWQKGLREDALYQIDDTLLSGRLDITYISSLSENLDLSLSIPVEVILPIDCDYYSYFSLIKDDERYRSYISRLYRTIARTVLSTQFNPFVDSVNSALNAVDNAGAIEDLTEVYPDGYRDFFSVEDSPVKEVIATLHKITFEDFKAYMVEDRLEIDLN